jgi:hypothetical protein
MIARIIVTVAFIASVYTLGRVAECTASQPYGTPGVALYNYINGAH